MSKRKKYLPLLLVALMVSLLASCGAPEEEVAVVEPVEIEVPIPVTGEEEAPPLLMPLEPPEYVRTLKDSDSSIRSYENRAVSGDNFGKNLYERPFTAEEMVYQPDLDIYTVDFGYDDQFFFFNIVLYGMNPEQWGLNGVYGIEFDRDLDGRGDLIVWAENIQEAWSIEGVSVYIDVNQDVGGDQPLIPDTGYDGDSYDSLVEIQLNETAFARMNPEDEAAVQIAVSRELLQNPEEFMWGAWADNGLKQASMLDYNDAMSFDEAGSPIYTDAKYPLKGLFNLDNTCRLPYGFAQGGKDVPGACINIAPVVPRKPRCTPREVCGPICGELKCCIICD